MSIPLSERIHNEKRDWAKVLYLHKSTYKQLGEPLSLFDLPIVINPALKCGGFAFGAIDPHKFPNRFSKEAKEFNPGIELAE